MRKVLKQYPVVKIAKPENVRYNDKLKVENYLDDFVARCVDRLSDKEIAALKVFMEETLDLEGGTICSGTEAPMLVLRAVQKVLGAKQIVVRVEHKFSCEKVEEKRRFAQAMVPGFKFHFKDAEELADGDKVICDIVIDGNRIIL